MKKWDTWFDERGNMIHHFHERLQLVLNFEMATLSIIKDGEAIETYQFEDRDIPIDDYERVLNQANEAANKLRK